MPASADEFADLEASLLAKQQLQFDALQKRLLLGNAAAPTGTVEEIDQPFAEYARTFYLTALLVVYSLASMVYSSFTTGLTGSFNQVNFLFPFALAWTASATQIYTTLDSAAATVGSTARHNPFSPSGRRALSPLEARSLDLDAELEGAEESKEGS